MNHCTQAEKDGAVEANRAHVKSIFAEADAEHLAAKIIANEKAKEAGLEIDEKLDEGILIESVLEYLPQSLALAIISVNQRTQLPLELCLQTALAATNLVAQTHYDVDPLFWGSTAITEFFVVLQARSGGKSAVFREFFKPLEESRAVKLAAYQTLYDQYQMELAQYNKDFKAGIGGTKPESPCGPWPIVSSPTLNGLIEKLSTTNSLGIISDEGTKFINSYDQRAGSSNQQLAASLCNLWNGDPIERLTGIDDTYINARRCCLFLMVQRQLAAKLVSNDSYGAGGFESRILVVDSPAWMRPTEPTGGDKSDMDEYNERITHLFMKDPAVSPFDNKQLTPTVLRWDDDAKQDAITEHWLCNAANNELDENNVGHGDGIISKSYEHMCKLAGTLCAYSGRGSISTADWTAAKILVDFYIQQKQRIGQLVDPDRVGKMQKAEDDLYGWLLKKSVKEHKTEHYRSVMMQCGPVSFSKYLEPDQQNRLLHAMKDKGMIEFSTIMVNLCIDL